MSKLLPINVSSKGLVIKETKEEIYIINDDVNIEVLDGVNASILDVTSNKEINVTINSNAVVNYYVLDSSNTKRTFNVSGEVLMSEIGLEETIESLDVNLLNENARFESKCLSFASKIKSEYHVNVVHSSKSTFSNISNTGVALEGGKLLFDVVGKIKKGMKSSKCSQLSRGIVMDNISKVDAKPVLLIDEYDCFANHGASIGKVSDDDLFYLMSRGLSKNDACLLILMGVIRPFIDAIPLEDYKNRINDKVTKLI